ncbi:MAG: DUF1326 domain-containing protein [Acidobacteriota bacterium]|nr:DUF1326 domain-containing protein [Acidobacteriota bacterium]
MRISLAALTVALVALPVVAADLEAHHAIHGDYLEARTAEVFVGYCLANAEVDIVGREAILAWKVRGGEWDGAVLDGLSVVAVVQSDETLGDPDMDPGRARSVLLIDDRADAAQGDALVRLAQSLTGSLLDGVVDVQSLPIDVELRDGHGMKAIRVGDIAQLEVRDRRHADGLCGNEDVYYGPLAELEESHVTYTLRHEFSGEGLDGTWKSPEKTSSWVGSFVR